MIHFGRCDRILIEKVTLCNSPMFHIGIRSDNVTVRGVSMRAPASTGPVTPSHNTDACDVSGNNILVQDCDISVGDDDFTCGGHTSNVLITHCTYGNGHGLSIGSYTQGWVSNLTVVDCTFNNTETGIRIKSDRDRGGFVHDLTYLNLRMTNVGTPISIYGSHHEKVKPFKDFNRLTAKDAAMFPAKKVTSLTPFYQNLTFSNITATVQPGHRAGMIFGLPEACVSNVLLQNVTITADKPFGIFYAQGVRVVDCKISTPEGVNKFDTTHAQVAISSQ
jgi:polygalacturonase